jgi:hypothetical protein
MQTSLLKSPPTMNTSADQHQNTSAAKPLYSLLRGPARDTWLSTIIICLMIATMLLLFRFPVRRAFANVEVNYNEGWNAYRAAMVAKGIPLYGKPPQGFGTATAYPPVSFHLIGMLGNANTFTAIGRCVSLISLLAAGVFVALSVKQGGGSPHAAVFSFLLYEIGIVLLRADRVGMYDPQLLGEALSVAGLYFYLRNPDSRRLLCLSALLFCLAGFTKQNLIAFPAAVAIDLLFRSRKLFVTWAGAMLASAGLLIATTLLVDGRYFAQHLMGGGGGRAYSGMIAWSQFHHYVEKFQALLVIGTAWSIREFRSRLVLVAAFVLSHGLAFLLGGGFGVDLNIFFNAFAATVILCGLALSDITSALVALRPGALNSTAAVMFGLFFISIMIFVPGQLRRDRQQMRVLPTREKEFNSAVQLLKARPGPALCESHLLCYEAGKPFEFEPFSVRDQVKTGWIQEEDVLQLLRTHHFQTVEIALRSDEEDLKDWADLRASLSSNLKDSDSDSPIQFSKERRFSPSFMNELLKDYQLSMHTSQMVIFCPK